MISIEYIAYWYNTKVMPHVRGWLRGSYRLNQYFRKLVLQKYVFPANDGYRASVNGTSVWMPELDDFDPLYHEHHFFEHFLDTVDSETVVADVGGHPFVLV